MTTRYAEIKTHGEQDVQALRRDHGNLAKLCRERYVLASYRTPQGPAQARVVKINRDTLDLKRPRGTQRVYQRMIDDVRVFPLPPASPVAQAADAAAALDLLLSAGLPRVACGADEAGGTEHFQLLPCPSFPNRFHLYRYSADAADPVLGRFQHGGRSITVSDVYDALARRHYLGEVPSLDGFSDEWEALAHYARYGAIVLRREAEGGRMCNMMVALPFARLVHHFTHYLNAERPAKVRPHTFLFGSVGFLDPQSPLWPDAQRFRSIYTGTPSYYKRLLDHSKATPRDEVEIEIRRDRNAQVARWTRSPADGPLLRVLRDEKV